MPQKFRSWIGIQVCVLVFGACAPSFGMIDFLPYGPCRKRFQQVMLDHEGRYRVDAYQLKGLRAPKDNEKINEYVERRRQARFFKDLYSSAQIESGFVKDILRHTDFKSTGSRKEKEGAVIKTMSSWAPNAEAQKALFPFFRDLNQAKAPIDDAEGKKVLALVHLKEGLALHRAYVFENFVSLPLTSTIESLPQGSLTRPYAEIQKQLKNHLVQEKSQKNALIEILNEDEKIMRERLINVLSQNSNHEILKKENIHFAKLAEALIQSNQVPESVKEEIKLEQEMKKRYGFRNHIFYRTFLEKAAEYFEVTP